MFCAVGEGSSPDHNHVVPKKDDKKTYITVETREGKLEKLKINLDDENFGTSTSILEYLVEQGEINPNNLKVSVDGEGKMLVNYIFIFQELTILLFFLVSNSIVVFNILNFNVSEINSNKIHRSISE